MVHTGYDPAFVALSVVIAVFASYAALDLGARVRSRDVGPRWAWGAGAAIAMGGGIWSMHFVGMLAFEMGLPAAYDLGLTLLSLAIAVGSTAAGFAWVWRRGTGAASLLVAGPLMGGGVAAMHYTGMAAMRVPGNFAYDPAIVAVSVAIAVTAATAALWLTFRRNKPWQKFAAACVMGLAVAGMHYTGMAAATFTAELAGAHAAHAASLGVNQQNLALAVTGVTFVILFLAMMAGSFDQRRVQRRLHVSEERFRSAVRAVDGVMWTADATGNLVEEQPGWEQISGQSFAEYRGGGWTAAIHPEDLAETRRVWELAVRNGMPYGVEHRIRSPGGAWRYHSVRAVPVRDADGTVREWVGVHADVTERRAFETQLKDARDAAEEHSRAKSRFLANMSHELRTPLSAVIGYSEMLEEEAEELGQDSLLKDLGKIKSNAQHLLGLINDVLDLSKVEAEKMELYAEDIDVAAFVTDAAGTVEALVAKKGNVLALDVAVDVGLARTDATKLRQCVFNLLSNAAKFTEGGTITLRAAREVGVAGDWLRFTVRDTGIGMSPEQVGRLFERFTQADESTTRNYGGTGLGLALSRAFAQLLGGDITVDSVAGEGTSFTLCVPAVAPEQAVEAAPAVPENQVTAGDLVLVIDDEANQRELMSRFLERQRFAVRTAGDGRTGLDLARSLKPRAILLDVMMPEMDGWSVLAALKADPETAGIPVVMVSFVADAALSASLGAVEAVSKPVDWTRLRSILDQFRAAEGDVLVVDAAKKDFPVARLCKVLDVSPSGYFAWKNRPASTRQREDLVLLAHVRSAFTLSHETYGSPRMTHELREQGLAAGRRRVARLMRENGLKARQPRRFRRTTDSGHAFPIAPNHLDQDFTAAGPDRKWGSDISSIWTREGWLYLAVVLDLYSRRVVGWAASDRLHKELALTALRRALVVRQPGSDLLHHSDRGSQYCSNEYQAELRGHGIVISMSGKGNCFDNAMVETFFKTLKSELVWRTAFQTRAEATVALARYIDGFYNPRRRHSALGYTSPIQFERGFTHQTALH